MCVFHIPASQGYKHQKAYIIAEGPMASTVRNMWKLVYDTKCGTLVMLSKLTENGMVCFYQKHLVCIVMLSYYVFVQESCWQYWPDTVGEVTEFGEYIIDLISEEALTGFTIRTLSVLNKKVG